MAEGFLHDLTDDAFEIVNPGSQAGVLAEFVEQRRHAKSTKGRSA
jgi:hypothetical protein